MRTFRRVLYATDFSNASKRAFQAAIGVARAEAAQLLVVHVLPALPLIPDVYISATTYDELLRGQRQSCQKQLARLVAKAKAAGARASGILVDFGVPAERIARLAKSKRADVIVIGTHGRTGLRGALLGSVAARTIVLAPCPVLTVRA